MKEKFIKALFIGITVAIGITLVMLIKGEKFSLFSTGVYGLVAFAVDYIFSLFFNKPKR